VTPFTRPVQGASDQVIAKSGGGGVDVGAADAANEGSADCDLDGDPMGEAELLPGNRAG